MIKKSRYYFLFCFATLLCVVNIGIAQSQTISLAGEWRFAQDPMDKGIPGKWFSQKLKDHISLPGSMLTNHKGDEVTLFTKWTGSIYDSSWYFNPRFEKYRQPGDLKFPFWLTPEKHYVGAAWYQKEINIPAGWKGRNLNVFLERCHTETMLWVDDAFFGMQNSMVAPHEYSIGNNLKPGKHIITIRVDNRIKEINVGPDSHSLTDHTQGNWNGIIGKMSLEAKAPTYIVEVQVYPEIKNKSAKIVLETVGNPAAISNAEIFVYPKDKVKSPVKPTKIILSSLFRGKNTVEFNVDLGDKLFLWDEFNPNMYELIVKLKNRDETSDTKNIQFGLRDFKAVSRHFNVNSEPVFLRGTVDCAVFPLTGFPPTTVAEWEKIFRSSKAHGLNHMRFHSWCPPEAAFTAADKVGFYLQVEAPTWPNHGVSLGDKKPIDQFIMDETNRIAKYYGNHPSYCMLASGNEPAGKNQADYLADFVAYWQKKDSRRVYTGASVGMSWPLVPTNEFMVKSGARNLNWPTTQPESNSDYHTAVENYSVPYVTHEMGQWCVFPDFTEIKKYTGAYQAKNFEMFRQELNEQGMGDEAEQFHMASGKLQLLCYKNEIEKTLRTQDLAGFQLLGLQDFPGQGTALVGTVNPFWEDKRYSSAEIFSSFCNATVPLLRTEKFTWTNPETFNATVELFHFGQKGFKNIRVYWQVTDAAGKVVEKNYFAAQDIGRGKNTTIGEISYALNGFTKATQLNIEVGIENTAVKNSWNFWVYPVENNSNWGSTYYTDTLDAKAETILNNGGKVFLNLAGKVVKGAEITQTFTPVFWNTSWFKMRPPHTLGILLDEKHPAFKNFPTSYHSDLQWWGIVNKAQVMHLEDFPPGFRSLVQPIDTWFLNRRLGLIFEAVVGNGKLMVSSANLNEQAGPAAKQLLSSLQEYMNSNQFDPKNKIAIDLVRDLSRTGSKYVFDAYTKSGPDELRPIQPAKKD